MTLRQTGTLVSRALSLYAFTWFIGTIGNAWISVNILFEEYDELPFDPRLTGLGNLTGFVLLGVFSAVLWQKAEWVGRLLAGGEDAEAVHSIMTAKMWFRLVGVFLAVWSLPGVVDFLYSTKYAPNTVNTPILIASVMELVVGILLLRPFDFVKDGFFEDSPSE